MSPIKHMLFALSLVVSGVAVAAPAASAQGTTVVMIDEGRLLGESKAGKDIQTKLQNLETQMKNELEPIRATLETDGKALQTKVEGKTREVVAADTALLGQLTAYQKRAQEFAQKQQVVSKEFQLTERKALIDFNKAIEPALMEVVNEKNAQIVMSKAQVIYSADAVDVTPLVITKLDAKTPTIAVSRQRLPAQPAQ
ncbi:OmpH family outer membrane protein [Hyphomonas sp.]|jgi:Skp family chaperone for outer membrane proteins|uniref:OmpH family outer membrane protein n=1 Tax=Hyphomonas sp. TaxID=87 RepID=UPI0039E6AA1B